jgi:hypothetical protein
MKQTWPARDRLLGFLVVGDVVAWVVWLVAGLATHRMRDNLLMNGVRIAAPFVIGWAVAALLTRAYDLRLLRQPMSFFARSVLCWLLAVGIGLGLRATLFGDGFVPIFAAVTIAFTALFVLGWRAAFVWAGTRRA